MIYKKASEIVKEAKVSMLKGGLKGIPPLTKEF